MKSPEPLTTDKQLTRITWFGHSAFLLQIDGKNILIDPMLGDVPSPVPWFGTKRFSDSLPIAIDELPKIDAVLYSHDHYDHLDYGSVKRLKEKVDHFYVPLGVGAHLESWEVDSTNITELDWWDEVRMDSLKFIAAPAQHFSGRGPFNRNSTLWCSWIIQSADENIFFSGDSGYGPHFKEIGKKYGPFDLAMMECGQYNERWKEIHMLPEQTAQAAQDVQAKLMMPIHWGSFALALHTWKDPVKRVTAKAGELGIPITTPMIGEPVEIANSNNFPDEHWWEGLE